MLTNLFLVFAIAISSHLVDSRAEENNELPAVNNDEVPFLVSISRVGEKLSPFCTGSLITNKHVLTSGYCLEGKDKDDIEIYAGDNNLTSPYMQKFPVKSWFTFADWVLAKNKRINSQVNNAAVITLDVLQTNIPHANISSVKIKTLQNAYVDVAAWGPLNKADPFPLLRIMPRSVIPQDKCSKTIRYSEPKLRQIISRSGVICTIPAPTGTYIPLYSLHGAPILDEFQNIVAIHIAMASNSSGGSRISIEATMNFHKKFINYALINY